MKRTVYHDVREDDRIFLCIDTPSPSNLLSPSIEWQKEVSKKEYNVERELDPNNDTPEALAALVAEMEEESGFELELSDALKEVFGL